MNLILDTVVDMLSIKTYNTADEMGKAAAENAARLLNKYIEEKDSVGAIFAAAPSQNQFIKHLLKQNVDWSKVRAYHMDEYLGLEKDAPQRFGNYLKNAIFDRLPFASVNYIHGHEEDPAYECERYANILREERPEIIFLGIGENGHLAFNDPPVADFEDPLMVKVVELDNVCRNQQVNDGCFQKIDDVPTHAITLTMSMIMSVDEALAIVPGPTKRQAIKDTVKGEISTKCPASILRKHKSAILYTDRESAADLL